LTDTDNSGPWVQFPKQDTVTKEQLMTALASVEYTVGRNYLSKRDVAAVLYTMRAQLYDDGLDVASINTAMEALEEALGITIPDDGSMSC
jgi:hypothetical protein